MVKADGGKVLRGRSCLAAVKDLGAGPGAAAHPDSHPGFRRGRLGDEIAMLAEFRDDFPAVFPQVGDRRASANVQRDLPWRFVDGNVGPGFGGKEGPPIVGDGGKAARLPSLPDRLHVVSSELAPIRAQFTEAKFLFDEPEGGVDCKVEIRGPLGLSVAVGKW